MRTFLEWIEDTPLCEFYGKHGRELINLLKKAEWVDASGDIAIFDSWEEGSKENHVHVVHPKVGKIMITVSRGSKVPPEKLVKDVLRDYRIKVETIKQLQAKRKAV